jgi:hypothetical protein
MPAGHSSRNGPPPLPPKVSVAVVWAEAGKGKTRTSIAKIRSLIIAVILSHDALRQSTPQYCTLVNESRSGKFGNSSDSIGNSHACIHPLRPAWLTMEFRGQRNSGENIPIRSSQRHRPPQKMQVQGSPLPSEGSRPALVAERTSGRCPTGRWRRYTWRVVARMFFERLILSQRAPARGSICNLCNLQRRQGRPSNERVQGLRPCPSETLAVPLGLGQQRSSTAGGSTLRRAAKAKNPRDAEKLSNGTAAGSVAEPGWTGDAMAVARMALFAHIAFRVSHFAGANDVC